MSGAASRRELRNAGHRVLITPEGVPLPLTLASRGGRFGALFVDLVLITVLMIATTVALIYIAGGTSNLLGSFEDSGAVAGALEFLIVVWIIAMFVFRNAYFLFFELGPRGATPGKRMARIRIASRDGGRLTAEMVVARNLLRDIELFLPIVFLASASSSGADMGAAGLAATAWFLIFALMPFFNKDRLRAGDMIAGTWVVESPRRRLEAVMSVPEPRLVGGAVPSYTFSDEDLSVYGEFELQTLERVLREDRPASLVAVYEKICAKLGWQAGKGDERAFLEAYYTQLRARLETNMRLGERKADKHS